MSNNNQSKCLNKTEQDNCDDNSFCPDVNQKCCFEYLKPLTLEGLFKKNDCQRYEDTLCQAKIIRNAFFGAKAAVFNFVNDVDDIEDNLSCDISGNKLELQNVKDQYIATLNHLSAALYSSLRQTHCEKLLINVDLCKVSTDRSKRTPQKSQPLVFVHPKSKKPSVLAYIPGVTIMLNIDTKELKVKFCEPDHICGFTKHGKAKKPREICKEFVLGPAILNSTDACLDMENEKLCEVFGIEDIAIIDSIDDHFDNLDSAIDYFDEIVNYQDCCNGEGIEDNDILGFMNYVDKVINSMEQAHRFVVQLSKINNSTDEC